MNSLAPSASLRPYIKAFLIIESNDELVNRVLPDTSVVIAFRYKGTVQYVNDRHNGPLPTAVISGLRRSARLIQYAKDSGNILVQFKEAGAAAFFRQPLHEFVEASVSLDNLVGQSTLSYLEEQIAEAKSTAERVRIIEQFLLARLNNHKLDSFIEIATQTIRRTNGKLRIKELADNLSISQDAFEKRFRRVIGTTPKHYASIIRMKSIINHGIKSDPLIDTVFEAGYFDQPHFNKDFKVFTGQTPGDFFKSPCFW